MGYNIVLSVELIEFLKWVLKNHRQALIELVVQASSEGLFSKIKNIPVMDVDVLEVKELVAEYLNFFEQHISKQINCSEQLVPSEASLRFSELLEKSSLDPQMVQDCINFTILNLSSGVESDIPQGKLLNMMFSNLLKNWKPSQFDAVA